MPEKLEGRVIWRAGMALSIALGSAVLSAESADTNNDKVEAEESASVRAQSFAVAIPVKIEPLEMETTTTQPPTTTTEMPTTTTTTQVPEPEPPPPPPAVVSGAPAEWMAQAGIPPENYDEVDYIMTHESGWDPAAQSDGGCIGLGQNCPDGSGNYWLDDACPNWQNDPVCQLVRFQEYAYGRYGDWDSAAAYRSSAGWW